MSSEYNPDDVRMRIRDLRKEQGWTQEELAEKINASWNTIAKIECGLRNPSVDLIIALTEVFDTTIDYLVLGIPPEQYKIETIDKNIARIDEAIAILLEVKEELLQKIEEYKQQFESALS